MSAWDIEQQGRSFGEFVRVTLNEELHVFVRNDNPGGIRLDQPALDRDGAPGTVRTFPRDPVRNRAENRAEKIGFGYQRLCEVVADENGHSRKGLDTNVLPFVG